MRRFILGLVAGLVAIPVVVFVAGWFGLLPTTANAAAPAWETAFAHRALDAAATRRAPHLRNPVAPTEANLRAGMKLFKDGCAGCHGLPDAKITNVVSLYPDPPYFAGHPPTEPDWQLFWIVKYGVRYSAMFAWDGQWGKDSTGRDITDDKIWTVVTFLRHLDSLPPAVSAEWHSKSHQ
jgi:mono/diheme cytochrome c family protein